VVKKGDEEMITWGIIFLILYVADLFGLCDCFGRKRRWSMVLLYTYMELKLQLD